MLRIKNCHNCDLYKNQKPLLQNRFNNTDVMFVGLSAVKTDSVLYDEPFSKTSKSGGLLRGIAKSIPEHKIYFTNMVKCLPLLNDKIRYPNSKELSACFQNLEIEIDEIKPKKIVLFGKKSSSFVSKRFNLKFNNKGFVFPVSEYKGIKFMDAYHPSYILIYKRNSIFEYKKNIVDFINS
ncbi:uracil-DNA glycosylase family protein [Lutibacter sp.]